MTERAGKLLLLLNKAVHVATQVINAVVETLAELLLDRRVVTLNVAFPVKFCMQSRNIRR